MTNQKNFPNKHESDITKDSESRNLILHNDDVNTFDHVISSLIAECNHESHQAEQCALIAHNKGKCDIMDGTYAELNPVRISLLNKGLNVTID